jgi:cystathionine beta-lyase/cystathionine gamma-synthase
LGAITAITHLLKSGDEIVCFDDVYGIFIIFLKKKVVQVDYLEQQQRTWE